MSSKNKKCKVCGKDSDERNVCLECKIKYPYRASTQGNMPFSRKELFTKESFIKGS